MRFIGSSELVPMAASCSICVESYGDADSDGICSTVCGHVFHFSCMRQWLRRVNTCPLCNRSNPQPGRIYLDLKDKAANSEVKLGHGNDLDVVIKGLRPNQMILPLRKTVMMLINIMKVPIKENDIGNVLRTENRLRVSFRAAKHRDIFLRNKTKLRNNSQTSAIRIHEILDDETEDLFKYCHKLKQRGYKIIFATNNKVYVKKETKNRAVNILSKNHVDILYRNIENKPTSRPAVSHTTQQAIRLSSHHYQDQYVEDEYPIDEDYEYSNQYDDYEFDEWTGYSPTYIAPKDSSGSGTKIILILIISAYCLYKFCKYIR